MTGFARLDGESASGRWTWEIRSVNARGLEQRYRLPPGFDRLEPPLRAIAGKRLARGAVTANLTLVSDQSGAFAINDAALEAALTSIRHIAGKIDCAPPRPEAILALKGVIDAERPHSGGAMDGDGESADADADAVLIAGFEAALARLQAARAEEGSRLGVVLAGQLAAIEALSADARARGPESVALLRARIESQVADLLGARDIDPDRLAQEVALLAVKADIREEIDRLDAHVTAARALLEGAEPAGRKLDFLAQELNREANTLCAKAPDTAMKEIGLNLKSVIDQLREQIQNIE